MAGERRHVTKCYRVERLREEHRDTYICLFCLRGGDTPCLEEHEEKADTHVITMRYMSDMTHIQAMLLTLLQRAQETEFFSHVAFLGRRLRHTGRQLLWNGLLGCPASPPLKLPQASKPASPKMPTPKMQKVSGEESLLFFFFSFRKPSLPRPVPVPVQVEFLSFFLQKRGMRR